MEMVSLWSRLQKQRFLKAIAELLKVFEFTTWVSFTKIDRMEAVFFAASYPQTVVDVAKHTDTFSIAPAVQQAASLIGASDKIKKEFFEASHYESPMFVAGMLYKCDDKNLVNNIKAVCSYFSIPLPTQIRARMLANHMTTWMKSLDQGHMSQQSFLQLVLDFCDGSQELKDLAFAHSVRLKQARNVLACYWSGKRQRIDEFPREVTCWKEKDEFHRQEWELIEIEDKKEACYALKELKAEVCVTYRLESPAEGAEIAILMICALDSDRKYVFRGPKNEQGRRFVKRALSKATEIYCLDSKKAQMALGASFQLENLSLVHTKRGVAFPNILKKTAGKMKRYYCQAHSFSLLRSEKDIDESVLWHLALELELLRQSV